MREFFMWTGVGFWVAVLVGLIALVHFYIGGDDE